MQHTALHCNALKNTDADCTTLQHTHVHFSHTYYFATLQHAATHSNTLQHTHTLEHTYYFATLQHAATHCNTQKTHTYIANTHTTSPRCNTLQHTATHLYIGHTHTTWPRCNTLHQTATHYTIQQHTHLHTKKNRHWNTLQRTALTLDTHILLRHVGASLNVEALKKKEKKKGSSWSASFEESHCNAFGHAATH